MTQKWSGGSHGKYFARFKEMGIRKCRFIGKASEDQMMSDLVGHVPSSDFYVRILKRNGIFPTSDEDNICGLIVFCYKNMILGLETWLRG